MVSVTNYDTVASEFLRALRGHHSQTAFARRLGYRSNVVHSWEVGRAFPTAARSLLAACRVGLDVTAAVSTLYRKAPEWLARADITTSEGIAQLLRDLQGKMTIAELAAKAGRSRFATARWLHGQAEPRLPDFFRLLDVLTLRLLDFIGALVEPGSLPSIRQAYVELERARKASYQRPWSQAVLRALETTGYATLTEHRTGWIAARLDIPVDEETRALELLEHTGQVEFRDGKFRLCSQPKVADTRRDPKAARALCAFWADVARQRMDEPEDACFSHSVFAVSEKDYQKIRNLQKVYYQEVRSIVDKSQPVERVALLNLQLLPLSDSE